jgi:hypothetical protein
MKKLRWSAIIGSGFVCGLYWDNRLFHSTGPSSSLWIDFSMFFLIPGYYFLAAIGLPTSSSQMSQKIGIALMVGFDCMFWSLVLLMAWTIGERFANAKGLSQE